MNVGSFGDVTFSVSSETMELFQNLKMTQSASYAEHKVHGAQAVIEFTGFDSAQLSFDMTLSAFLGINPKTEITKLRDMQLSKKGYPLALGTDLYGTRWVIKSVGKTYERFYKDGSLISAKVQVTLMEMG